MSTENPSTENPSKFSKFFTLEELVHSNTAVLRGIKNEPSTEAIRNLEKLCKTVLDPLRLSVGVPIRISSGYRSKALNEEIGGVQGSRHMQGKAADIKVQGWDTYKVSQRIRKLKLPIRYMKVYPTWVHIDIL